MPAAVLEHGTQPMDYPAASPLTVEAWEAGLASHPDQLFAGFVLRAIRHGVRVGFERGSVQLKPRNHNMLSCMEHPEVVDRYIEEEVAKGRLRVVGPCELALHLGIQCSPFGVIPKKSRPNAWRLIVDLSSPEGHSVNDGISKELASVSYMSVDDVIACILNLGRGTLMAKRDIKQAYRNIPVHPQDQFLLGMKWRDTVFVDTRLPFGLRSAPLLFTVIADALQWMLQEKGAKRVFHYVDDFILLGRPGSKECAQAAAIMDQICEQVGLPIEPEKNEGPSQTITFLGVELDSSAMVARLPHPKLGKLKSLLASWRGKKVGSKIDLLSLIGVLSHACKVVRAGRTFLRRLIDLSTCPVKLDSSIRLNLSARSDIEWWFRFGEEWNGRAMLSVVRKAKPDDVLTSDASGSWGCGAFVGPKWFQVKWSGPITGCHITVKELAPIVIAAAVWGPDWRGSTIRVMCDNEAVVAIINQGTCRDQEAMHLMRCLAFIAAMFQVDFYAQHIKGVANSIADALSRDHMSLFRSQHPQACEDPTPISQSLRELLLEKKPDWSSRSWTQLWSDTFGRDWQSLPNEPTSQPPDDMSSFVGAAA